MLEQCERGLEWAKVKGALRVEYSCVAGWKIELLLSLRSWLWQRMMHEASHWYQSNHGLLAGFSAWEWQPKPIFGTIVLVFKLCRLRKNCALWPWREEIEVHGIVPLFLLKEASQPGKEVLLQHLPQN